MFSITSLFTPVMPATELGFAVHRYITDPLAPPR